MTSELHLVNLLRLWASLEPGACRITFEDESAHPDWPGALELRADIAWRQEDEVEWHGVTLYLVDLEDGVGIGFENAPLAEFALQGLVQHAASNRGFRWQLAEESVNERGEIVEHVEHVAAVGFRGEPQMTARGASALDALLHAYVLALEWAAELEDETDEDGAPESGGTLRA